MGGATSAAVCSGAKVSDTVVRGFRAEESDELIIHAAFLYALEHINSLVLTKHTTDRLLAVWPRPGKEPLVDVDRAVVITVHH